MSSSARVVVVAATVLWTWLARMVGRSTVQWTGQFDSPLWRPFLAQARLATWREYVEAPWMAALLVFLGRNGSGHLHTVYASMLHDVIEHKGITYRREQLMQADGGNVTLDWVDSPEHSPTTPTVLFLHGLTGGSQEAYIKSAVNACRARGWRCVVFNARGCAGSTLTTPQLYCAAYTLDLDSVAKHLRKVLPSAPIVAVGYSLGANILTNYLGEKGHDVPFIAGAAICNPFDLLICSSAMHHNYVNNAIYGRALGRSLKRALGRHRETIHQLTEGNMDLRFVFESETVRQFDERFTRHVFGYRSVDDYYRDGSSAIRLRGVAIPHLSLSSFDDPISVAEAIPFDEFRLNPLLLLGTTEIGGHVSWHTGPLGTESWVDGPLVDYFQSMFDAHHDGSLQKNIRATGAVPFPVSVPLANMFAGETNTTEKIIQHAREAKNENLPIKSLGEHPFAQIRFSLKFSAFLIALLCAMHVLLQS